MTDIARRTRLLLVTDAWRPQVNGVARTYEWLARALQGRIDVRLLTPEPFARAPLPTYPEIGLALASPGQVARAICDASPDVVHIATEGPLGFLARLHCRREGIPFTTCFHTRYPEYLARRAPIPLAWSYAVLRRFHAASRRTLVATQELAIELRARGFEHVSTWRRGIDVAAFAQGDVEAFDLPRPLFLYVGRLAVEKSVEDFLSLDLPGSKLVVGDGPERARLQQAYPAARFLGAVAQPRLGAIYRSADAFVFPSRTDTFGLVMAEALAAGAPVACRPSAGARTIFAGEQCGAMSEDLRAAAFAALEAPRETCRRVGATHSLEASADAFLELVGSA